MLSRRPAALVGAGLLERRRYSARPPRDEYVLTASGRDFHGVLMALLAFGNRHFAPEGESIRIVDAATGTPADPVLVDRASGRPLVGPDFKLAPGPAATPGMQARLARSGASPPPRLPLFRPCTPRSARAPGGCCTARSSRRCCRSPGRTCW